MYTLYYKKGACSLAINALLRELGQDFELIDYKTVDNYKEKINSAGQVPVLDDNGLIITEGAAIALYLLNKHESDMLPKDLKERANALQWLMFANATVHPSYGKLFFSAMKLQSDAAKKEAMEAAVEGLNANWKIVNERLQNKNFVCGDKPTMADFFLAVYANWNTNFENAGIELGKNTMRMIKELSKRDAFTQALDSEHVDYKIAA